MNVEVKPGYKLTETGVIPEDWEEVLLDSVAKRGTGHTPDKKHPEYWNGSIKWVSLQDSEKLDDLYINDTAAKITPAGINNSSAVLHPAGSVVLSRDAGVGKSAILLDQMAVSQHFMAWCCGQRLDNHFLYYWMQAAKPEFERIANGSTIKTIGLPYFKELKLSIPSLEEQKNIAFALSDMDALIRGLNQLIAKKRDIKQAAMQQLLTGQQRLPGFTGEWEVKRLGDIAPLQRGFDLPNSTLRAGPYPVVYSNGILNHHENYQTHGPGVVTGRSGTIGKLTYIESSPYWPHNTTLWVTNFRGNDPKFVFFLYKNIGFERFASGSGVPTLNRNDAHAFETKIPPTKPEQTAIANMLSDMDSELATLETRINKARQLKQGMMQELLTGRIRLL